MATSRSLNRVTLIGNLTRDPQTKQLANGAMITTFGIATNKSWKTQDGRIQEKAEYHNIVAWNKLAEICANLLSLGMLVYLEGEITSQEWDMNGSKMKSIEIRISDMKIMDSKGKQGVGLDASIKNAGSKTDAVISDNIDTNVQSISQVDVPAEVRSQEAEKVNSEELF